MRSLVGERLPKFTEEQSKMIQGCIEFVGINYYTARYVDESPSSTKVNLSYTTDSQTIESSKFPNFYLLQLICIFSPYLRFSVVVLSAEKNGIPIGQQVFSLPQI